MSKKNTQRSDAYMTIKDASKRFGYTEGRLYSLANDKKIRWCMIDGLKHVNVADLREYIAKQQEAQGTAINQKTVEVGATTGRLDSIQPNLSQPPTTPPTREQAITWLVEQLQVERVKVQQLMDLTDNLTSQIRVMTDDLELSRMEVEDLTKRLAEAEARPKGTELTEADEAALSLVGYPVSGNNRQS